MNAVIVDIRKKQAAALDGTGRVVRIPNVNYEIGQTIELHEVKPVRAPTMLRRLSTGVAAAVLVAMIGTGTAYAMPYGTVALDGDSSIEYTINCFDYVVDVKASDEEGEALLEEIGARQLRHRRIDAAVATTMDHINQHTPADPPEEELHIRAYTGSDRHTDRLREELEPLLERDRPLPPDGDCGSETPPEKSDMPPADLGQFPVREEGPGENEMHPDTSATGRGSAPDGAAPYNLPEDSTGSSPEGSMPNPDRLPENREENEERFFMPNAPEASQTVKQELPPEREQTPNMGRVGI